MPLTVRRTEGLCRKNLHCKPSVRPFAHGLTPRASLPVPPTLLIERHAAVLILPAAAATTPIARRVNPATPAVPYRVVRAIVRAVIRRVIAGIGRHITARRAGGAARSATTPAASSRAATGRTGTGGAATGSATTAGAAWRGIIGDVARPSTALRMRDRNPDAQQRQCDQQHTCSSHRPSLLISWKPRARRPTTLADPPSRAPGQRQLTNQNRFAIGVPEAGTWACSPHGSNFPALATCCS
jgi:hypothetical protein